MGLMGESGGRVSTGGGAITQCQESNAEMPREGVMSEGGREVRVMGEGGREVRVMGEGPR